MPLTNGSGSRRPKKIRIRIRNTVSEADVRNIGGRVVYLSAMVGLVAFLIGFLRHIPVIMSIEHSQVYMISFSRELVVYRGCHYKEYK